MKKLFIISFFLFIISGCSRQDYPLQQQININIDQTNKENPNQSQIFENNLKCQERGDILKTQYNNVFSVYFNEYANNCYVRYYDRDNNNYINEASIDDFGSVDDTLTSYSEEVTSPIDDISVIELINSVPELYGGVTYKEVVDAVNSISDYRVKSKVIKYLLEGNVIEAQKTVGMFEGPNIHEVNLADGYIGEYTLRYFKVPFPYIESKITNYKEKNIGYIEKVYIENDKMYIDIDYIQRIVLSKCFQGKNYICGPSGYDIINENPKIRKFELSKEAIVMLLQPNDIQIESDCTTDELGEPNYKYDINCFYLAEDLIKTKTLENRLVNIYISNDNKIQGIIEQYIP